MTARPPLEVADVFRHYGPAFLLEHAARLLPEQRAVLRAVERCRTSALGGHTEECDACGHLRVAYNSCRNRHCPKCQNLERAQWLEARREDLLPVEYFHVVFTLPEQIAEIALGNKRVVYGMLFSATAETLERVAADPRHLGAEIGFLAVLHTWGQSLQHHPHLHCVIPGGGLSPDARRWVACRRGFFLPVRVLARLFRRLFLERLRAAYDRGSLLLRGKLERLADPASFSALLAEVSRLRWVVYAKRPFGGPHQVLDYLGRYTHRVAITNNRLLEIGGGQVSFRWRDYRSGDMQAVMTLEAGEFIRRFLLHVLPRGFQRIRHYGLLSNRRHAAALARCREVLAASEAAAQATAAGEAAEQDERVGVEPEGRCPACGRGRMRVVGEVDPVAARWRGTDAASRASPEARR